MFEQPSSPEHIPSSAKPHILAQVISDFFSPLLIPTYGMAMAMWLTSLRALPERSRFLATLLIAMITGLLPLLAIATMRRTGAVSDNSISDRRQRPLPMAIVMACYIGAGYFLACAHAPLWLQMFFYGASLAVLIALGITLYWKISAHTTAMGGLVGMLLWFAVGGIADVNAMVLLSLGIICAGAVATSRIALGRHTLWQVIAGFFLGICCTFIPTWIFCH